MTVTIGGKEYAFEIEGVWGPIYTYETVVGDKLPFDARKHLCMHMLYWCILLRSNRDFDIPLEIFLERLEDPRLLKELSVYYATRMEMLSSGQRETEDSGTDKKKD